MNATMSYKGYTGEVEYDAEAKILYGHVIDFDDVITFESERADEIEEEFHRSVDVYLDWCIARGKEPKKPFSGKLVLRIAPEVHRDAVIAATRGRKSLNRWLADVVARAAREETMTG
ncbi:MAG: type II toxin-antitoxin system HicB family antitoxin [Chloroflexota bacterium]|nr:type II toxin-antitoxin system HicB family antitoxin [Chloroflexota bacterium]